MSNGPAWLASGAATAGAAAAWFAAYNGVRTLRQARTDSIGKSRPMVAAELRDAYPAHAVLYLVIRNYGPSVARDVQVTFVPELPDPTPEEAARSLIPHLKARYVRPISTLTPGAELKNIYFSGRNQPDGAFANRENVPNQVTVNITYRSADGNQFYEDSYYLDTEVLMGETYVTSSRSLESQAKRISKELHGIREALKTLDRGLSTRNQPQQPSN